MVDNSTVARPYADAIFKHALETNSLDSWSDFLNNLNLICSDSIIQALIADPKQDKQLTEKIISDILDKQLKTENKNLFQLLSKNQRLSVAGEIYQQYEEQKAKHQDIIDVKVKTAFKITKKETDNLTKSLKIKLGSNIRIQSEIDKSLIGGIIVQAGDLVIDNSIRNKIQKISIALA